LVLSDVRVLITGGAGFIGSNLAHYWLGNHPEDRVTVYDSLTYAGHRASLAGLSRNPRFSFVEGDIRDSALLSRTLNDIDLVVHLAAESHNDRAIADPMVAVHTNAVGTAVLLEACRRSRISRFHHVSTDEVYGSLPLESGDRFTLASPYAPRGPYSASKAASDHFVRAWFETYGVPTSISNSGNNFGPYQHPEKLIPRTITNLLLGKSVPLYGDGKNIRDWIYVEDHCSALDLISRRGTPGRTYLVSAQNERSNRELVGLILKRFSLSAERIVFVPDRPGHDRRYALDPSALVQELAWKPRYPFDEALFATIDWYRSHRDWWQPLLTEESSNPNTARRRVARKANRDAS
jgi:dTDP-glucose 4,6-dehydratase